MTTPVSSSPAPPLMNWRVIRLVISPVVIALLLQGSGLPLPVLACLSLGAGSFAAWRISQSMQRVESRLRKTTRDILSELPSTDWPADPTVAAPTTLDGAEERLYLAADRFRQAWSQLGDENRHLSQSNTLFEGVLETMHEAVLVVDVQGRLLFINPAACELFEVSRRDSNGRLVWEAIRSGTLQELVTEAFRVRKLVRQEVEVPRQKRILDVSAIMLPLQAGEGCLVVAHDVTELRKLEKMRRDFVSNVSHELKTPLTSIQAYADTLLDGGLEDEDSSRMFVERIVEQSVRLNALVMDLLRLAKIESEPEAFQIVRCDAIAVAQDCLDNHAQIAAGRQLRLDSTLPEGELAVWADRDGLQTILNNLVTNALNYTPSGGRIGLNVRMDGQRVLFEVQDTGVGIAREHQSRIFERFYRVDKARTRATGGTGLGLSIVRHLVEVIHGEIQLESELDCGSTFRVWLPAQPVTSTGSSKS